MEKLIIPGVGEITPDFRLSENFILKEWFKTSHDNPKRIYQFSEKLWGEFCDLPEATRTEYFKNLKALAGRLQELRDRFGSPIRITSGWRSKRLNSLVGGASKSYHLRAMAADIDVDWMEPSKVQAILKVTWKGGLGLARHFTHLDIGPHRLPFTY